MRRVALAPISAKAEIRRPRPTAQEFTPAFQSLSVAQDMTFKFHEGALVALKEDRTHFLPAGTRGVVFCRYTTEPTSHEVNFQERHRGEFSSVVNEDEIEFVSESAPVLEHMTAQAA